ncbi:hypothetical protein ONS95_000211 [Cadophora gregata]|uniref:uncharacterized protein n=1 Tax=Cadophora gregata TaxID=51156 RepID=UPI0026DBDA93|nr:uncharacterized protein ONS95_000211 [Cadophora gregata]KAK0128233.1 hypothetical protein ONS95_000211 [Cadophora gregata]
MASKSWMRLATGAFYAYPKSVGRLPFETTALQPVTVIQSPHQHLNGTLVEKIIANFLTNDDVFNHDFMQVVLIAQADILSMEIKLDSSAIEVLKKHGMQRWELVGNQPWKAGPYFAQGKDLYQAWKMYPDTSEAFYLSTIADPSVDSSYIPFDVSVFAPVNTIAVPSRLYFSPDDAKPLHGVRVAVKDIYNLKGVKTAGSSRSYRELYPECTESASSVQKLIDLGAIIVGKTKTTTFADRQIPTGDWIDTHAPFNPRGDGYVVPGGSSSGSGSALASYEWLDYAIGTDTSGSIRWPAAHCGLFGFKPTFDVMPMDGIIPSSLQFDVPAFLSRDVKAVNNFAHKWFGAQRFPLSTAKKPTRILYPLDYTDPSRERTMSTNKQVLDVFESFVAKLEAYLGVKRTPTYEYILNYDSWHNNRQFVSDYNKKFGRNPYLPPSIANRWKFGKNTTDEQRGAAVKQVELYKTWFEANVLDPESGSLLESVLVLPWTAGFANYRDTTKPIPNDSFGRGFWSSYITSFSTGPEFVFPIGTWSYDSKVTERQERLPVAAGIVGAPGSDYGILQFVEEFLANSDLQETVITGSEVFAPSKTIHSGDKQKSQEHL